GITIGLALTSWLSHRHDARAALTASATATLMCADAWFDLCTSAPGRSLGYAAAEAAGELVVAAVCLAIGLRTQRGVDGHRPDDPVSPAGRSGPPAATDGRH
ncbi:MAG TPA: hypothetical protein VGJ28_02605, partial [Micromonosporaceae bacterium]